ncbi:hypothetical protein [Streptomyces sp. NPDC057686]|uniref:hypothetical protein n=1 Tax=Streptomyces sp. NPDC057686 TaxID=3346212 RepID=UPI0036A87CC2
MGEDLQDLEKLEAALQKMTQQLSAVRKKHHAAKNSTTESADEFQARVDMEASRRVKEDSDFAYALYWALGKELQENEKT